MFRKLKELGFLLCLACIFAVVGDLARTGAFAGFLLGALMALIGILGQND